MEITIANQRIDTLCSFVNEKNVSISGVKDLQTSLGAHEAVFKAYPPFFEEHPFVQDRKL